MSSNEKLEINEKIPSFILNAPKFKFKKPVVTPTPFSLNDSDSYKKRIRHYFKTHGNCTEIEFSSVNTSEPDNADCLACKLIERINKRREGLAALPFAVAYVFSVLRGVVKVLQNQRKGVLSHGVCGVRACVAHGNSVFTAVFDVDVVVACREQPDIF